MSRRYVVATLGTFASLSVCLSTPAADIIVNPGDSIQDAIVAAVSGADTVIVNPGTYAEAIDFLGKAITVQSSDPANPDVVKTTIIEGPATHVVQFVSGEGAGSVLSGFTILGGVADGGAFPGNVGGGIYVSGSSPTVSDCVIVDNNADLWGGGIYVGGGSPSFSDCIIGNNTSGGQGGGAFSNATIGGPSFTDCEFTGNEATAGAGLYTLGGLTTVTRGAFNRNTAVLDGGGMYTVGDAIIADSSFCQNQAALDGGGLFNASGGPTLSGSSFFDNLPDAVSGPFADGSGNDLAALECVGAEPVACPADTDADGQVGIEDFLAVLAEWGSDCTMVACTADGTGDNTVGIEDFLQTLAEWGPCE